MLGIEIKSPLEIFIDNENILLKRYSAYNACQITEADREITLSPNGAKYLAEELEKNLVK